MASVIPKLNIDVEALNRVRRKIQCYNEKNLLELEPAERETLMKLIDAGRKTLYPDKMAINRYQYHIDQLAKVDPEEKPELFNRFLGYIEEFQKKYCT